MALEVVADKEGMHFLKLLSLPSSTSVSLSASGVGE